MQMMKERGTVSVFHFLFWMCYSFSVTYSAFEWRDILFFSAALAFIRSVLIVISVALDDGTYAVDGKSRKREKL